ncbi:ankyrin repeat, PH and SEC7 domain containing protein secG-like [Pecten maximus]|uniref:ankyrin repeat, PH and SEC7 domain containing protein secG-like n=1 Tax=Pecten maximus TaxID=6579 RepID=UPI001458F0BC|nr:ankyrin repeat, PH and SEC7 domain containing protein secG-like [Pecten maximus]
MGRSGLSGAAEGGHIDMVNFLLDRGADPAESDALSGAALGGHIEIVKILLDKGADVNKSDALSGAAGGGHIEIVKILLDKGADVNKAYPLIQAASRGHEDTVRLLLRNGADWNQLEVLKEAVANDKANFQEKRIYESLDQDRIAMIKKRLSLSSKTDMLQISEVKAEVSSSSKLPVKAQNVKEVGHKGVGKSCFVKQIQKEYIPEGGPAPTDTADFYVNYLAYDPNSGFRKKLDENGEEETGRIRIKRIIDRYRKQAKSDKESPVSVIYLRDQGVKDQPASLVKAKVRNEVASTSSSAAKSAHEPSSPSSSTKPGYNFSVIPI